MKFTLDFKMPEEEKDFKIASRANAFYLALSDLEEQFRTWAKYGEDKIVDKSGKVFAQAVRERFYSILSDRNIDLEVFQ